MFEREFGIDKRCGLTFTSISRIYIGRKNQAYKLEQSPLANPFVIGKHGSREQVVESYRRWLWEQVKEGMTGKPNAAWDELKFLQSYAKKLIEKYDECLTLTCWCQEWELCHGDVIIRCLEWMNRNNL
jgi:hypothetical protein